MSLIKAFPGLRPAPGRAADVAAPPYDVMSAAEACAMVCGKPWSFLHISRAEVDLPEGTDPYAPEVYGKAAENLERMVTEGLLVQDDGPCLYVYRLTQDRHVQTGLVAAASVSAYDTGRIKRHELTRPTKEDDRVRQIDALDAQTGPVFLAYASDESIDGMLAKATRGEPAMDVTAADGVRHQVWVMNEPGQVARMIALFEAQPALYVADGHHRSAAASRVSRARAEANPAHRGDEPYNYFLTVIFPHDQTRILDYNRVIRDLNGLSKEQFLVQVKAHFTVEKSVEPVRPACSGEYGMYLDREWYRLRIKAENIPKGDPVAGLDISLLSMNLIEPVLGIGDPRLDQRIDFVGGIRGLAALEQRVSSGDWAVAFSLYPTSMEELMAVADAGAIMPPKSTWFEPKLADGLVSHLLK